MTNLLRAGLLALACLVGALAPAAAGPVCQSLEAVISEATEAAKSGAQLDIFTGEDAARALVHIEARIGPYPGTERPSTVILLRGPAAAVIAFGEGTRVCLIVPASTSFADGLFKALRGEPA